MCMYVCMYVCMCMTPHTRRQVTDSLTHDAQPLPHTPTLLTHRPLPSHRLSRAHPHSTHTPHTHICTDHPHTNNHTNAQQTQQLTLQHTHTHTGTNTRTHKHTHKPTHAHTPPPPTTTNNNDSFCVFCLGICTFMDK